MNVEQLMRDTFTAREHLAPDEDEVFARVMARAGERRSLARPAAVLASAAAVAAVTAGVVVFTGHRDEPTAPAAHRSGAATRSAAVDSPSLTHRARRHPAAPADAIVPLPMPFDLGWLPDGDVHYIARRINTGSAAGSDAPVYDGEYMLTVDSGDTVFDVDVQQMPGGLDVMFKSGPGRDLTIDGRSAVESVNSDGPGGYEIYFRDAAGGIAYVNVDREHGTAGDLPDIGRHIARTVSFPGTATVTPTFGLGALPDGLHMRTFDVEQLGTSYELGDRSSPAAAATVGTNSGPPDGGTPGDEVQGHSTTWSRDHGYLTLSVRDAVRGRPVQISGAISLAEAYRIAAALQLPS